MGGRARVDDWEDGEGSWDTPTAKAICQLPLWWHWRQQMWFQSLVVWGQFNATQSQEAFLKHLKSVAQSWELCHLECTNNPDKQWTSFSCPGTIFPHLLKWMIQRMVHSPHHLCGPPHHLYGLLQLWRPQIWFETFINFLYQKCYINVFVFILNYLYLGVHYVGSLSCFHLFI